jgi:hypothetical protein
MKYILSIVFVAGLLFSACEVEYYSNPNEPEVAPTDGLLNRVQKRFTEDTHDEWFAGRQMLLWVQYWNQVNYTEEDRFQYRETSNKGGWDDIYGNAQDMIDVIAFNTDEDIKGSMAQYGTNENQIAVARTMLVYIYLYAVELWGDVPYYSYGSDNPNFNCNALKDKGTDQPVYAPQSEIYADMLKVLGETSAVFAGAESPVMAGDNFFGGNAERWMKFANSLRLRIANRIKGVSTEAATIANALAADAGSLMESNDDNAGVTFEAMDETAAPMYKAFYVSNRTDFAPSYSFVELLKGNRGPVAVTDPRLGVYVQKNDDGNYYGIPLTSGNSVVVKFNWESLPGEAVLAQDFTEMWMEYSEVCFILSELNGWDQAWYEKGVRASMEKWGVADAQVDAYIAALPPADEENVMNQKYIALYMQPMEAWSEYRRTGYPKHWIKPGEKYEYKFNYIDENANVVNTSRTYTYDVIGDLTDIPTRNKYLVNEQNINKAELDKAIANMGGDAQNTKLWWQK